MGEKNKVKYTLRNVHYVPWTMDALGNMVFGTMKSVPGAVSMSLDAQGDPTVFFADGIRYFVVANNNGYDGDLEIALITKDFRKDILCDIEDENGVLIEDADAQSVHFALLFEFEGDKKNIRHVLSDVTVTRPGISGKTREESTEVQTEPLKLNASPIYIPSLGKRVVKAKTDDDTNETVYQNWYSEPYVPTGTVQSVAITGANTVEEGTSIELAAATIPAAATVVWSTTNEDVATVTNAGVVSGISAGRVSIIAALEDDSTVFAAKTITVTEPAAPDNNED